MLLLLLLMGPIQGCGTRTERSFPSSREPREGDPGRQYRVKFEVSCTGCSVHWEVGEFRGTDNVGRSWSHSLWVIASESSIKTATLTAVPGSDRNAVTSARILVGGEVRAHERGSSRFDPGARAQPGQITISTTVPPVSG
jgi:hypothetical protein